MTIALAGVIGGIVGSLLTYHVQSREVDVRLVEIAVGILRAEPKENIRPAREWATDVLTTYSEVPLSKSARRALLDYPLQIEGFMSLLNEGVKVAPWKNELRSAKEPPKKSEELHTIPPVMKGLKVPAQEK